MEALPFDTKKLQEICRHNDVTMVGVFGSVARGEATEQSDIDLLVRFSKRKSLLNVVAGHMSVVGTRTCSRRCRHTMR